MKFQQNIPLAPLTSIGLGGPARFMAMASNIIEIKESLLYARGNDLPVYILGGGSNTIFSDKGFQGLVLRITSEELKIEPDGHVVVDAGYNWDRLVLATVERGLAGLECLSGIPGSAGATPIQNVGAYGQEIASSLKAVHALERSSLQSVQFSNEECGFDYRWSRFKAEDRDRYIITRVEFQLQPGGDPVLHYPELQRKLEEEYNLDAVPDARERLQLVRSAVLQLRRSKSMVLDPDDPNSRSCGSFFMNPILEAQALEQFLAVCKEKQLSDPPVYVAGEKFKTSAAWLIEKSGFQRGYTKGGVAISSKHSLALINVDGKTGELLELQDEIRQRVHSQFGILLEREPVLVD